MVELNYFDACTARWDVRGSVEKIKNESIGRIFDAFANNLLRVRALLVVPGYVFFAAEKWQASFWRAWQSIGNGQPVESATVEQRAHMKEQGLRLMAETMMAQKRDDPHYELALKYGLANFEGLIEYAGGFVLDGTKANLSMAVLSSWTAFEVLATDLWVAAVNHFPKTLGRNAFRARDESMSMITATEAERKKGRFRSAIQI